MLLFYYFFDELVEITLLEVSLENLLCILRNVFELKGMSKQYFYFVLGNEIKLLIIQIKLFEFLC